MYLHLECIFDTKKVPLRIMPGQVVAYSATEVPNQTVIYLASGASFLLAIDLHCYEELIKQYWEKELNTRSIKDKLKIIN